LIYKRC